MSLWDKLLVAAGIGSARVETKLERAQFVPGDTIRGVTTVTGGKVSQPVDDVYLDLVCSYYDGEETRSWHSLLHHRLFEAFEIQPEETREFPFEVRLPLVAPLTMGGAPVYLQTALDIPLAKDSKDMDPVQVGPAEYQQKCFEALKELGFVSVKADCHRFDASVGIPFLQVFEFRAESGPFHGNVSSLSLAFRIRGDGLGAVLWVGKTLPDDEFWSRQVVSEPEDFKEAIGNA